MCKLVLRRHRRWQSFSRRPSVFMVSLKPGEAPKKLRSLNAGKDGLRLHAFSRSERCNDIDLSVMEKMLHSTLKREVRVLALAY